LVTGKGTGNRDTLEYFVQLHCLTPYLPVERISGKTVTAIQNTNLTAQGQSGSQGHHHVWLSLSRQQDSKFAGGDIW
jgi:hypothetical protein